MYVWAGVYGSTRCCWVHGIDDDITSTMDLESYICIIELQIAETSLLWKDELLIFVCSFRGSCVKKALLQRKLCFS